MPTLAASSCARGKGRLGQPIQLARSVSSSRESLTSQRKYEKLQSLISQDNFRKAIPWEIPVRPLFWKKKLLRGPAINVGLTCVGSWKDIPGGVIQRKKSSIVVKLVNGVSRRRCKGFFSGHREASCALAARWDGPTKLCR